MYKKLNWVVYNKKLIVLFILAINLVFAIFVYKFNYFFLLAFFAVYIFTLCSLLLIVYFYLRICFRLEPKVNFPDFKNTNLRSPLYLVRQLYTTNNLDYFNEICKPLLAIEIGVLRGDFSQSILESFNIKKLYLVDPFKPYVDKIINKKVFESEMEENYKHVLNKFNNNKKVELLRKTSLEASKLFNDEFFDFIYIDGDHSFESVYEDLNLWFPKLLKNGVIAGDDYFHPSGIEVRKAVNKFVSENNLILHTFIDSQFAIIK
jgi:hypothetical protein